MTKKHSIAVLLPTRGRTTALDRSVYSIIDTAADPSKVQLLLGFDRDDTAALEHFDTNLRPALEQRNINFVAMKFAPLGYVNIHKYYNHLAKHADADWLFIWNDDAFMSTPGWDQVVAQHTGQLKVLKLHTHNEHPYSIFPIVPQTWIDLLGYLTGHQMIDAWISQIGYMMDLIEIVDIDVTHDRHDLTGNNADATFKGRTCLEGKPHDPADFHHPSNTYRRQADCEKIATYLQAHGISTAWWESVKAGTQDPWEKLKANDINSQMVQFNMTVDHANNQIKYSAAT
jgi:hypothetical protein